MELPNLKEFGKASPWWHLAGIGSVPVTCRIHKAVFAFGCWSGNLPEPSFSGALTTSLLKGDA